MSSYQFTVFRAVKWVGNVVGLSSCCATHATPEMIILQNIPHSIRIQEVFLASLNIKEGLCCSRRSDIRSRVAAVL